MIGGEVGLDTVEFRLVPYDPGWSGVEGPISVIDILVGGARLIDLVRAAELPYALDEQRESSAEYAPEPAPLLAGDYMCLPAAYGWPSRHLLGEPEGTPSPGREDRETMVLTCTCGIHECWALMARIDVDGTTVRWSAFRNTHRDWDLSTLGPFTFSRPHYERSLQQAR